jgi:probable phosphoglycerate mutase
MRSRLTGRDFDGLWTSDLIRCARHAELAMGRAQPDRRLRELDFGDLEGKRWDNIEPSMQEALKRFDGFAAPRGETVAELEDRVLDFLSELVGDEHLIFTHGGVIRLLARRQRRDGALAPGELIILGHPDRVAQAGS